MTNQNVGLTRLKYNPKPTAKQSLHIRLSLDTATRLQRYRDHLGQLLGGIPSVSLATEQAVSEFLRMKGY